MAVPKSDRSIQLCIDFQKVNEITKYNMYLMPHVNEMIDKIGQAQYICMLDLNKEYWQMPLGQEDQEKMASATPWGMHEFKHVLFGLHGVAATFQRIMNKVLVLNQDYAVAFTNNMIIFASNWENHLKAL